MAGDIKGKYGTNNQAITLTITSLATSATVGREFTAIDNSTNVFLDLLFVLWFETGTVASNKQMLVYFAGSADGGTTYGEALTGVDAAFTRKDPSTLLGPLVIPAVTNAYVHKTPARAIAGFFGGTLPDRIGGAVFNDTGATLTGNAANNKAYYQGVLAQYT